jgi:hypothetical protein
MTTLSASTFELRDFKKFDKQGFSLVADDKWRQDLFHGFPTRDTFVKNRVSSADCYDLVDEYAYGLLKEDWRRSG